MAGAASRRLATAATTGLSLRSGGGALCPSRLISPPHHLERRQHHVHHHHYRQQQQQQQQHNGHHDPVRGHGSAFSRAEKTLRLLLLVAVVLCGGERATGVRMKTAQLTTLKEVAKSMGVSRRLSWGKFWDCKKSGGVECDEEGNVVGLYPYDAINRPVAIPSSLTKLTMLTLLDLSSNRLQGRLSSWSQPITALTRLKILNLANNLFWGPIPDHLFTGIATLRSLDISKNFLTGVIPPSSPFLKTVFLHENYLEGSLPSSLSSSLLSCSARLNCLFEGGAQANPCGDTGATQRPTARCTTMCGGAVEVAAGSASSSSSSASLSSLASSRSNAAFLKLASVPLQPQQQLRQQQQQQQWRQGEQRPAAASVSPRSICANKGSCQPFFSRNPYSASSAAAAAAAAVADVAAFAPRPTVWGCRCQQSYTNPFRNAATCVPRCRPRMHACPRRSASRCPRFSHCVSFVRSCLGWKCRCLPSMLFRGQYHANGTLARCVPKKQGKQQPPPITTRGANQKSD